MSMKTIMRGLVVACAAALGLNAWAETIACWNGDLDVGSTKGGLTISNLSSALYPEGAMKLTKIDSGTSNPKGIYLTTADGAPLVKDTVTFIFRYSGYDSSGANNAVLAADMGTADATHILQVFTQQAAHKINVGYNAAAGSGMALSNQIPPTDGMIAVMMSNTSGIRVLVSTKQADGTYSAFKKNGCQYSSAKYGTVFKSFMIGASDKNAGSYHRPGMTVDAIAVLDQVIDDNFTYSFPTEATYVKGSLSEYIATNPAKTFIPNATLADIKGGTIKAKINGGSISDGFKNQVIRPLFVTEVMDGETISKVTMQFQLKESATMAKVVFAECTQSGDNVVIKATGAKYSTVADAYGTDANNWTGAGAVVTNDTAAGYGIHELQFLLPSTTAEIDESVNWANAGITPAASGVKTVYVASGATITFAADDSVEGFQFVGKNEGDGVSVAGTIPSNIVILDREILSNTATISNFATAAVTVDGAVTMTTDVNVTAGSVITLNGGSLTGGDSARLHVIGNASISASGTASISNLWMGGTTHGVVATMTVAEGGELTLGKIVNSYTHTIVKDGEGVLKVTSNISRKEVDYQLKAGTLVGKDSETAITKHSSVSGAYKVVASEEVEGYTTYSLGPRTDAGTVELRSNGNVYIDNVETSLLEGDAIVVKTTWGNLWSFTLPTTLTDHTITLDSGIGTGLGINMKSDIAAGQTLVVNNPAVWLYENVGSGANVSGSGALRMWVDGKSITSATISTTTFGVNTGCTITINGDVTVSGTTLEINGALKLADGATLTIAKLEDEGEEITKVVSGVDGKHVEYSDGKYVLVDDAPDAPTATVTEITEDLPADIDAAYVFTIGESVEGYEDYDANFEVSFNRAIEKDSVVLKGSYGTYLWQQIDMPKDLAANEVWTLLPAGTVNYGEVMGNVVEFTCGVKNYAAANAGATMTVKLVLTKEDAEKVVMSTTTYTLTHAEATIADREVTADTPVETIVPAVQAEKLIALGVKAPAIVNWAKATGSTVLVGKEIDLEAFALDCAPDAVETAKENFKVDITIDADGTVHISHPEYNITPKVLGAETVNGEYTENNPNAKFFKAVIEL